METITRSQLFDMPTTDTPPVVTCRKFRLQKSGVGACPPAPARVDVLDPLEWDRTTFNADRSHRFALFRREAPGFDYEFTARSDGRTRSPDNYCAFIGMNPSGADEFGADPTVRRCYYFSLLWGYDALYMLNAFSLRSTDSAGLYQVATPSLPENDDHIRRIAAGAGRIVVAWGEPGGDFNRGITVEKLLLETVSPDRVFCFKKNKDGTPQHPLYQPSERALIPYFP